ncbi:DUF1285 domain-containing protein [Flavobacterium sp. W21_SRS_FM6]|uniref:DUF1285 domain-containing protein n=1 Tax=Flavobacterium sp. W21_SRS_FM6 TaxID=3240268 RepID=UPI003F8E95FB
MADFDLAKLQHEIATQDAKLPPVEKWDPPFCGDIDMEVKHDGSWHYMGTPISRPALVKMFASVIKRENNNYFLVTPVEKVGIKVIDSPFLITQWQQQSGDIIFTTNLEDSFVLGSSHPIKLMYDRVNNELLPYALVRRNLWARLHQNVFYQLAQLGKETLIDNDVHLVIESDGQSFSLGKCT